ncbi:hypothetical protein A9K65_021650 [Mesorhizobium sp. WSM1497]|nr:hypothetical protein A9K65_021650 [Mesorhizobium sp. WSM1497]
MAIRRAPATVAGAAGRSRCGLSVGYGSASQFSREYKRLFGASPVQDANCGAWSVRNRWSVMEK